MKPFDLKACMEGKPIRCRDARYKAEFACYRDNILVCWIMEDGRFVPKSFDKDGIWHWQSDSAFDLFMDTKTKWVRLYLDYPGALPRPSISSDRDNLIDDREWVSDAVEIELY